MPVICPTVTEHAVTEFTKYSELLSKFARRIHYDFADGIFTPRKLVELTDIKLEDSALSDVHIMYKNPSDYIDALVELKPNLVIFHAESDTDQVLFTGKLRSSGIKAGVALLPQSDPNQHQAIISTVDHVLIFGGKLGWQGGLADLSQLNKIEKIRSLNSNAEISWDGGVNDQNAKQIIATGVDVLNVGGFIKNAEIAADAYAILQQIASE